MVSHIIPNSSSPTPTQPCYRNKEPAVSIVQECTTPDCGCLWKELIPYPIICLLHTVWVQLFFMERNRIKMFLKLRSCHPELRILPGPQSELEQPRPRARTKKKDWVLVGDIVIILMTFSGGPLRKSKEPRTHVPTKKAGNPNLETAKTAWEESISELSGCRENWLDFHSDNLVSKISYWHSLLWGFLPNFIYQLWVTIYIIKEIHVNMFRVVPVYWAPLICQHCINMSALY